MSRGTRGGQNAVTAVRYDDGTTRTIRSPAGRNPGTDRRAVRRRARRGAPLCRRPDRAHRRRTLSSPGRRPLSADGDRVRPVPAADRAAGAGRCRRCARDLWPRPAHDRPPDRRGAPAEGEGHDPGGDAAMTEVEFEEQVAAGEIEIPSTLPVLPLKETVVFPQ